ncbi:Signal recognition particle receptor FtsY [Nitrosotalea sinensis]|uniref:Signal recognition particle receptor FtsY n=1 Tax=Nitrosotalea sinensis TaxID=1499975 RepID=A0A2H1EDT2_9ARCH|nr:signal recognition particle-docking protein FtsY [Candidatus Nitrosotalea sinensis]SHO42483.1 Signal recognition particle receptor FtsY [Candidatus Nitrosotalea sinensis]
MFEKLRNAFSLAAKSFGEKELKEKDIDEVLFELEIALLESDVATEVIDSIKDDLKKQLIGSTVNKDKIAETVKQELRKSISNMFNDAGTVDILSNIQKKKEKGEPYIISFMGINGTGKTTTIAKFANLLRENKYSVVIAAADTYRAGAIEQISEHGKRLNVKVIAQNYGSDPAAVARDAVLYAKSHKIDCILIDTAGRMQTSKNLMDQISKINKVVNPDLKLFVGDSLAGNDTVSQAREFHNYTKFDGAILTKSDADARGGSAISIVKVTSSPILYLGVGQEYSDLKSFNKEVFLETIFGPEESVEEIKKKPEPKVELKPEPKVELKPESKVELKPESKVELKPERSTQEISNDDPFVGISTQDIEKYSDIFDVSPPESDDQARKLAADIRKWISAGRPKSKPKDEPKSKPEPEMKTKDESEEEDEVDSEKDEKPIKKRSLFGWLKK